MSSPGIEPGPRPSQSRVRIRHTPRTCCFSVPRQGVEPRLAVPKTAVRPSHSQGMLSSSPSRNRTWSNSFGSCHAIQHTHEPNCQHPDLESNQDQDLRRVLCCPLHHRDKEPTTGFAPASSGLQDRRLASRATSANQKGDRAESNRRQTDSQSVSGNQHRTRPQRKERELNPQGTFVLDRLPTGSRRQSGCPSVLFFSISSPTRNRTRNFSLEARHDVRFTIEP